VPACGDAAVLWKDAPGGPHPRLTGKSHAGPTQIKSHKCAIGFNVLQASELTLVLDGGAVCFLHCCPECLEYASLKLWHVRLHFVKPPIGLGGMCNKLQGR
jgi:hypothetical protein